MSKKRKNLIALLGVLSALFITTGVSLAFFTYTQSGTTENSIKSGTITFWYDEQNREGNSIGITDALPLSDTDGKAQTKAFNFRITSNTSSTIKIPYTITLRQKQGTDDIGSIVKVYLAKTTGYDASVDSEEEVVTSLFSSLDDVIKNTYSEKILYEDEVPVNSTNYNQNYRLKMWLDSSADYSDGTLNNKTFTVTVNVYAEGLVGSTSQPTLGEMILADNPIIYTNPTLTTTSNNSSDPSGLYSLDVTNGFGGQSTTGTTYYFRGEVENNKVKFAGLNWRVIRINENGTVRLILDGSTDTTDHKFNSNSDDYSHMYYSNSDAKNDVETWYDTNITGTNADKVASGNYFCEAAKVTESNNYDGKPGNAEMTVYSEYTPDLVCPANDGNNKGLLNNRVGLITYDEVVLAGDCFYQHFNGSYYLYKGFSWWTMSPSGFYPIAHVWYFNSYIGFSQDHVADSGRLRPVINLKADVTATYNEETGYYEVN